VRERLLNQFILVHSTLSCIQFPKTPLGSTSNQSQIATHTNTNRWSWYHKNHSPSLLYTPLVRTPSDFTGFPHTSQVYKRTNTTIMKGTDYTWVYKNHRAPMIRPWTSAQLFSNLANPWKTFLKNQSQSHCIWYLSCIFVSKRKVLFIALKTSRSRQQLWAKTVLIQLQNRLTGFWKATG